MYKKLDRSWPINVQAMTSASDTLKEILGYHNVTQKEFAKRIGISQPHVSDILNRKKFMSPEIAIRIEIVTGLNAKLLLTLDFNYQLEQLEQMKKVERPELIKYDWAEAQLIIKEGNEELIVTYDYIKVDREVAIEASKRLVVDSIWKIANIELTRGVTFPQTQQIYEGR